MKIQVFLLFYLLASCKDNLEKNNLSEKNNELKWLLTGLPDNHTKENCIALFYGFQSEDVGGCVISKKLRDSINVINRKTNDSLIKRFGKHWRSNFETCVEFVERKTTR
jgi:hypothetical protein